MSRKFVCIQYLTTMIVKKFLKDVIFAVFVDNMLSTKNFENRNEWEAHVVSLVNKIVNISNSSHPQNYVSLKFVSIQYMISI